MKRHHRTSPRPWRVLALAAAAVLFCWQAALAQVGSARYSAIVVDASSGRIVSGANVDELRFPASLTKLMTLYMTFEALRDRRIQLHAEVPVSAWAASQPPSRLGLQPGDSLTVEQAILGLVTKSANDTAAALAEYLGGSEDRFAQMMTLRARALGMSRTNFRNASGLPDNNQWSTARDLATLARRIVVDFAGYYPYFAVPAMLWHGRYIPNHDSMLKTYAGADGMKTGYTEYAGHNLVTSAVHGNVRLIGVVLGTSSNTQRDQNMSMILDDGFARMNAPAVRFAGGFMNVANAAPAAPIPASDPRPYPVADTPRPAPAQQTAQAPPARSYRDRGVQIGPFTTERNAREMTRVAGRLAPEGDARVQPIMARRHMAYLAQVLHVSESEARSVCANMPRRGAACQVFRIGTAQTAMR